jgi:hypothetical protein
MKKIIFGLLIILISCTNQNKKLIVSSENQAIHYQEYTWNDGLCDYIGTFDSTKVSRLQINNSLYIVDAHYTIYNITVDQIYQLNELDIDSLDYKYSTHLAKLEKLDVINNSYWQNLKRQRIKELNLDWKLKRLMLLSYTYPDTLMSVPSSGDCLKYASAIKTGGEELLKIWKELNEKMALNNGDPENVRNKLREKMTSPDNLVYAQMDVITYGWWNSINNTLTRPDVNDYNEQLQKSFIKVQENCDEE